jgi:hypothetical protein
LEAAISGLIDRGHRAIRVLSVPDAWESGPEERWTLASAERPDGRSLQIVRENLEAYS